MKKQTTRRALVLSVLSLFVCVAMLVGTTFAWFTDSVTSGRNKIQSGNLDVVLEYWDGAKYTEVTSTTKLFDDAALWEPGHTEVAYLKVSNAGSLALKYQLAVNVYNEVLGKTKEGADIKLSDYLVFSVVEKGIETAADLYTREDAIAAAGNTMGLKAYASGAKSLAAKDDSSVNDEAYVALIIYMPTSVDNKANHNGTDIPSIEMGVTLVATQDTVESDSFGPDYDDAAWVAANADALVKDATELSAALKNGGLIALSNNINGDVTLEDVADDTILNFAGNTINGTVTVAEGEKITINGQGGVAATGTASALKVNKNADITLSGGKFTSENTAITVSNRTEAPTTITIEEGTVITAPTIINLEQLSNYAGAEIVINGGEFNSTYTKSDARPIKVHGGDVTINGGTFTIDNPTGGNCYFVDVSSTYNTANDGTNKYIAGNVEINGGTFKSNVPYTRAVFASMSKGHIPGTVVINGGYYEFTASNSYLVDAPANVIVNNCTYIGVNTANVFNISSTNPADLTITVNGGNYTVRTSPAGCFNYSYADRVILKGGTINSDKKLADSLAAGYHVEDNGDGTFSIVAD